jgi:hypothetical protein
MDPAQRSAALADLMASLGKQRAEARGAREEAVLRKRVAMAAERHRNGVAMLVIGGLFLVFAVVCLVGAVVGAVNAITGHPAHPAPPDARPGFLTFGLFWLALGGGLFFIGVRYVRAERRDRRLRERGVRGGATVRSYRERDIVVDGNRRFDLVLEVAIPGRPPFTVKQSDYVPHPEAVTTGAALPVFVDPDRPEDVMIDWFALS